MQSINSYQDIKTPEDIEEEDLFEARLDSLLDDFDPEEAAAHGCSYQRYKQNCINQLRRRIQMEKKA